MSTSTRSMRNNVMRRLPKQARQLVEVALSNYPSLLEDINRIVQTHSCRVERSAELIDHLMALIYAEVVHTDPGAVAAGPYQYAMLRMVAFNAAPIDEGKKDFTVLQIERLRTTTDGYEIMGSDGWSFWVDLAPDGYEPQIGSEVMQHRIGISHILSIVIDGHIFRYKTLAQDRAEHEAKIERQRAEERARFPEHDAKIARLPEIFQQRIHRFQRAPFFREDLEGYEIFVAEQAVMLAGRWKTPEKLQRWSQLNYNHKVKLVPELEEAGHSGNSFYFSTVLAWVYLSEPNRLLDLPGALSPLVGSNAYFPPEERKAS